MESATSKKWMLKNNRFVCYLDIMGFKDMVMRKSHDEIYELLSDLSKNRQSLETPILDTDYSDAIKTVSFSDSIVIFTKDSSPYSFTLLTLSVSWLFAKAIESGVPLKGALSFGQMSFNASRQIFFGQPLIDAYLLEEDVQFYGIVVHNTVEKFIVDNSTSSNVSKRYVDCPVPFKFGKVNHLVLDWVQSLENVNQDDCKIIALNLMKKQRENTSGNPRKYIDNTIDIINFTH